MPPPSAERTHPSRAAVVLPARNEAGAIGAVVRGALEAGATPYVVDNGSTDGTADVARAAGAVVTSEQQPGYGIACRRGMDAAMAAGFDVIGFMDADGSDPPEEIPRLLAALDRCDGVLGVRRRSTEGWQAMPPAQKLGNWLVPAALRVLLNANYTDMPSCKFFRREALASLDPRDETYGFTIELLVRAHALGLRIEEIPIAYRSRTAGESKVSGNLRASVQAGLRILSVVARHAWRAREAERGQRAASRRR